MIDDHQKQVNQKFGQVIGIPLAILLLLAIIVASTRKNQVRKVILIATAAAVVLLSPAQAAKNAKTPEETCQAQALASIGREWPNVLKGQFEIILKGNRCLVFLQANSRMFDGKRAAWLIDGKTGALLSEFYAPSSGAAWKDGDRGLCSYRGGKFPTGECSWSEYLDKADQM